MTELVENKDDSPSLPSSSLHVACSSKSGESSEKWPVKRDSPTSSSNSNISPSSSSCSPSSGENEVPSHTSYFDRRLIDKLALVYKYKSPLEMVVEHMSSFASLTTTEMDEIDGLADELGLETINFNNLDEITPREAASLNYWKPPDIKKSNVFVKEFDISKFLTYWEEFGVTLNYILKNKKDGILTVSEAKYQCLFEQFLKMFGLHTVAQPAADKVYMKILNKKISSIADILCLTSMKPSHERNILAVCKVKNSVLENDDSSDDVPAQKRRRICSETPQRAPHPQHFMGKIPISEKLLAQHVGELFAYFEKSVSENALLGMTIEKTFVTFSQLCVKDEALKIIKETRCGSVKLKEESRPILYYSKRYNYLNKEDRKSIVKALLSLKVLECRRAEKDHFLFFYPFCVNLLVGFDPKKPTNKQPKFHHNISN